MEKYQTLLEANYSYIAQLENGEHLLFNNSTKTAEIFFENPNHASWGLIYEGKHLEFARSTELPQELIDESTGLPMLFQNSDEEPHNWATAEFGPKKPRHNPYWDPTGQDSFD